MEAILRVGEKHGLPDGQIIQAYTKEWIRNLWLQRVCMWMNPNGKYVGPVEKLPGYKVMSSIWEPELQTLYQRAERNNRHNPYTYDELWDHVILKFGNWCDDMPDDHYRHGGSGRGDCCVVDTVLYGTKDVKCYFPICLDDDEELATACNAGKHTPQFIDYAELPEMEAHTVKEIRDPDHSFYARRNKVVACNCVQVDENCSNG